jgi:hypothetical protein
VVGAGCGLERQALLLNSVATLPNQLFEQGTGRGSIHSTTVRRSMPVVTPLAVHQTAMAGSRQANDMATAGAGPGDNILLAVSL